MTQSKTIREWFEQCDEPWAKEALENTDPQIIDMNVDTISSAVLYFNDWDKPHLKHNYSRIYEDLQSKNQKPMTKTITLTIEQARKMLGKDPAMDQLIRANFTEDELNPQPKYPKRWEDLGRIEGYYVSSVAVICSPLNDVVAKANRHVFATEQQAKSFGIIYPQLTQLMKVYRNGWVPDWGVSKTKYCVVMDGNNLAVYRLDNTIFPLSFPSSEIAEQFLTDHRDLITEFYKGM